MVGGPWGVSSIDIKGASWGAGRELVGSWSGAGAGLEWVGSSSGAHLELLGTDIFMFCLEP